MSKMKIAMALLAATFSGATLASVDMIATDKTNVTLNGRLEAVGAYDFDKEDKANHSRARFNVTGTHGTEQLYVIATYENETSDAATKGDDKHRYYLAGIGGTYGELVYGKSDGSMGMVTDFTDIMSWHGAGAGAKEKVADRSEQNMLYKVSIDGTTIKANYSFEEEGFSLAATRNFGALGLGAGLSRTDEVTQMMVATGITSGNLYVGGLVTHKDIKDEHDYTGYELAGKYTMGQAVFSTTYTHAVDEDTTKVAAIDATYFFTPQLRTYVSYKNVLESDGNDEVVAGLRYDI